MIRSFYGWPGKIVTGAGALLKLSEEMDALGAKRAAIITDKTVAGLERFKEAEGSLKDSGKEVFVFDAVEPNPTDTTCEKAAAFMKEHSPDVIIAIGGGSPMDCAKAADAVYAYGGKTVEYSIPAGGREKIKDKVLPIIAVPTTAGTGAEVTNVGVITDSARHVKFGVKSVTLMPAVVILDPLITLALPRSVTAATGIDALTHAIESYVSVHDFYLSDAEALYAIRQIVKYLPRACEDGSDIEARENMLLASMTAGASFSFNSLGLCHQMAHQLSSYFGAAHGVANALLLPHVMRFNMKARPERFADVAEALGCDIRGLTINDAALAGIEKVDRLCAQLGIPRYLDDIGIDKASVPEMAVTALQDMTGIFNPIKTTLEECKALYYECFRPEKE